MQLSVSVDDASVVFTSSAETVAALDGVTFSAAPGSLTAVTGESGSGKSTLLNVIAGLQPVTHGEVRVAGNDLTALSEDELSDLRLQCIGVVFQDNNLIPDFDALENVALPLLAMGWKRADAFNEARRWLDRVGILDLATRRPSKMSGGQRQRIGIARALVGDRSILVTDEPTGALDSKNSEDLFGLLADLAGEDKTIVVATHDHTVSKFATAHYTMRDGHLMSALDAERV